MWEKMRTAVLVLIFTLLATEAICSVEESRNGNPIEEGSAINDETISIEKEKSSFARFRRSSYMIPITASDEHGTVIEITLDPEQPELSSTDSFYLQTNQTNSAWDDMVYQSLTNNGAVNRRGIGRYGKGINSKASANRQFQKDTFRRRPLSMINAAINIFNPLPYFRGSFKGFQNVFRGNMKPFLKSPNKTPSVANSEFNLHAPFPYESSSPSIYETLLPIKTRPSPPIFTDVAPSSSSFLDVNNGLNLQIPPEFANSTALEVIVRQNGEISIVSVGKNSTSNTTTKNYVKNLVTGSSQLLTQPDSGFVTPSSQFLTQPNSANSFTNDIYNRVPGDNSLFQSASNNFNSEFLNKVKLVTDKPMIVNSIQDIINMQNLFDVNKNKNKQMQFENLLKNNPIPIDLSSLYGNGNNRNRNTQKILAKEHVYLLPFRVTDKKKARSSLPLPSSNQGTLPRNPSYYPRVSKNKNQDADIYYIDITIPDNDDRPIVNYQRGKRKNRNMKIIRHKRSPTRLEINEESAKLRDSRHIIDYNGWQPINIADPMGNEPTLVYKPPTLQRVHFGNSPLEEKPFYPVRPINPPVHVVRAETPFKKVHPVYGTEHVNYLHINDQSDIPKVYSTFKNDPAPQLQSDDQVRVRRKNPKIRIKVKELKPVPVTPVNEKILSNEEELLTHVLTTIPTNILEKRSSEKSNIETLTTGDTTRSAIASATTTTSISFEDILSGAIPGSKVSEIVTAKPKDLNPSKFSKMTKIVDDDYYFYEYEYDDEYQEPQLFEDLHSSSSDPFASIIPFPQITFKKDSFEISSEELSATYRHYSEEKNEKKAALHELLKDFGGVDRYTPYIFEASESIPVRYAGKVRGTSIFRPKHNIERKYVGKIVDSVSTKERPWIHIETTVKRPKKIDKKRKRPNANSRHRLFPIRTIPKLREKKEKKNPYNYISKKPTESLKAESLAALLRIFNYVTPKPSVDNFGMEDVKQKTFRYTQPTEVPKHYTSPRSIRYPPLKYKSSTDPIEFNVGVANSNSLSDVALLAQETNKMLSRVLSPKDNAAIKVDTPKNDESRYDASEYDTLTKNEERKDELPAETARVMFEKITEKIPKMDKDAVRRGDRDPFTDINVESNRGNDYPVNRSSYLVHVREGHSNVKIFGSYSDRKVSDKINHVADMSKQYNHLVTLPAGVEINEITARSVTDRSLFNNIGSKPFSATIPSNKLIETTTQQSDSSTTKTITRVLQEESIERFLNNNVDTSNVYSVADKILDKLADRRVETNEGISTYEDYFGDSGIRSDLKFPVPIGSDVLSAKSSNTEDPIDFSSLPSPFQAFSRLFYNYFTQPEKEINSEEPIEQSNEYLKHLRHTDER